jgi:DNA helicase-2/ATP-dependent DNA helicase PcrA
VTAYELDFFGRLRALSQAAQAQLLASQEARKTVQISLIAAVANTYLALLADDELLHVAHSALATRQESLRLVQLKQGSLPIPGSQKTISYEHLIVDEAQDLSPTDISVLRGVLTKRESMTLAGDTAQKLIFDNGFDDWKSLLKDLDIEGVELEPLRISYRSTREVTQFARAVLGPLVDPVEPVCPRTGAPVEQFAFGTTGEAMAFIAESLRSLMMREKKASIAVIARYSAQATLYYEGLRNAEVPSLRRIYGKEFSFMPGIDVVDVTQIKGLEYDYVVVVEVGQATFPDQVEARHLLHIAATRAVHQLWVTSVGSPSPLLPDVG